VAVALVVAVAVAGIQQPGREPASQSPESAQQPAPLPPITQRQAIVAAAQQVVLNPRTNTYFVAYPDSGKVNVVSAVDLGDIASIDVGGSPTALALNEQANTVLVLDSSHQLPGGIAAVFAAKSDTVAILSATGTGARVSIIGDENASLALLGSPVAIVALPQGGYGVLTDETLNGRITEIGADGTPGRSVSVSLVGRELSYNAALGQFTVAGAGGIAVATITGQVALSTPAPASNAKTPVG